ncbi:TPA: YdaU family protein [Pseudomonas aeruginosa]
MAALPYIQLYVADYLADTMHLSTEEHGAYLLLIFNYWQTGKPIPKVRLSRIARVPNDRWPAVEASLSEFFNDNGNEWVHERIERDLLAVDSTRNQRSAAGKASAAAKKARKEAEHKRESNARSTTVESSLQQNSTNRDTDTDTDTERDSPTDVGLVDASRQPAPSTDEDLFEPEQPESLNGHQHGIKPCPAQAIADLYHQVLPELPAVALLNDTRRRHLQARWREHEAHRSLDFWRDLFETVKASPFLMGNVPGRNGAKPFRATFDWIIAPSNFVKIVEGNYHA